MRAAAAVAIMLVSICWGCSGPGRRPRDAAPVTANADVANMPGGYPLVPHGELRELAATVTGRRCAITGENSSGRGDELACGPFPCEWGACVVSTCAGPEDCRPGFCDRGYCVRAAITGAGVCPPPLWSEAGAGRAPEEWRGCACQAQGQHTPRDREACGSFPCGPEGCYAQRCAGDDDCQFGLCSHHASGPHGYCVTDDPW